MSDRNILTNERSIAQMIEYYDHGADCDTYVAGQIAKEDAPILAKALRLLQVEPPAEPKPCEHLRSEFLAAKDTDCQRLFEMRKCLDCEKIFRVRRSLNRTGNADGREA